MAKWNLEALSDRERACLGHLEQAKKLGVSFSPPMATSNSSTRGRVKFPHLTGLC